MTNKEFEVRWQLEVRVTRAIILHIRKQANKHPGQGQGHYQSGFPPNPKNEHISFGSWHRIGRLIANGHHSTEKTFAEVSQQKKSTTSILLLVLPLSSCTIVTQPVLKRDVPAKQFWCPNICRYIAVELTNTEVQIQYQNPKSKSKLF